MVDPPVLFDTCILIDYLRGVPKARAECERHSDRAISIITWMEVMSGVTASNEEETRNFLRNFRTSAISARVAELAEEIRRTRSIKLPDAIIQATAVTEGRIFITRNARDFPPTARGVRIPYKL